MEKFLNSLYLQLFADGEGEDSGAGAAGGENDAGSGAEGSQEQNQGAQAKYTDADVDRILNQKFAEWQKKQEKQTSEAERLARMTTEEKSNARMKALEDKLHDYEVRDAREQMAKQARAILNDKNIHVSDELLANLIAEDAESTKASVESFVKLFDSAVESRVKEALKGETPRAGGSSGMTKEQIMAVKNRAERQRLISENMNLFKN